MHTVIIVEDEVEVAHLVAQYLFSTNRYKVIGMASDICTARSLLGAITPDLLLLDVYLPDGNGLNLLAELRSQGIRSEVVLLTAAKEVQILEKAMQLGVFDFLVKPVLLSRLDQALSRFESRQLKLSATEELTQSVVDAFMEVPIGTTKAAARLPKGVDQLTLQKIREVFDAKPQDKLTAQMVGEKLGVSRSTARRYLEFLLECNELAADQSYGSIGRPERCYHRVR
ncbi:response regulator [Shewanella baltica]|uniref:Transcriptional regulatory protein n=1 Tax=Shewanella baltica (strain OS155 / ATCC BAA-1091) TaxID=325240 RepID=A3D845_SHEB5|nr:response regulator [Shewanella baltica]ABN62908.1 response regulator receiver and unknown domain protein [Shewanella baltica OS155]AEH15249.1 response regulator receiver and unknown domain protein [Shewanella baltica OS117]